MIRTKTLNNYRFPRLIPTGYICFSFPKLRIIFKGGLHSRETSINLNIAPLDFVLSSGAPNLVVPPTRALYVVSSQEGFYNM